jgi:hypothetical protein
MKAIANSIIDRLVGVTLEELASFRKVNEVGAVSEDELAHQAKARRKSTQSRRNTKTFRRFIFSERLLLCPHFGPVFYKVRLV